MIAAISLFVFYTLSNPMQDPEQKGVIKVVDMESRQVLDQIEVEETLHAFLFLKDKLCQYYEEINDKLPTNENCFGVAVAPKKEVTKLPFEMTRKLVTIEIREIVKDYLFSVE